MFESGYFLPFHFLFACIHFQMKYSELRSMDHTKKSCPLIMLNQLLSMYADLDVLPFSVRCNGKDKKVDEKLECSRQTVIGTKEG
jgi:hypothetical protein